MKKKISMLGLALSLSASIFILLTLFAFTLADFISVLIIVAVASFFTIVFYTEYIQEKFKNPLPSIRISESISKLKTASKEIDDIIAQVNEEVSERKKILDELNEHYKKMSLKETELKKRIKILYEIPLDAADYFQKINERNLKELDKQSAKRDLSFFILGVLLSAISSIVLNILGIA